MHDHPDHPDGEHPDQHGNDQHGNDQHSSSNHRTNNHCEETAPTMSDAHDSNPDTGNSDDQGASPEMVAEITAALEAAMRRAQVIDPQLRMFIRACADAGFALTADDVEIDDATGDVTMSLSWKQFLHLTEQFEDVRRASVSLTPSAPSGPSLFDVDPPAGPVNPRPAGNGLHIEVPA
ncbi:MAG: hypothetical protein ACKOYG_04255 [Ilumatobacteraceae bacterium]